MDNLIDLKRYRAARTRARPVTGRPMEAVEVHGPYRTGRHPYMVRGDLVLTLPNPHRSEIGPDLPVRILRQAGVSRDEWQTI